MSPIYIIFLWLTGPVSVGILAGGIYLVHEWYQRSWGYDLALQQSLFAPDWGWNTPTTIFILGSLLLLLAIAGRTLVRWALLISNENKSTPSTGPEPRATRESATVRRLQQPDGSPLHVEIYGPDHAPVIILTHGWGLNSTAWYYLKRALGSRYRLITWDQPGLGLSRRPQNRDYSIENLARNLSKVLEFAGGRPALLVGHSIGGMILLTFCRLFPHELGRRVSGLVLAQTTHTNPVRTMKGAPFFTAMETPVIRPLMYLTIALSPLVWIMNWMSYLNGSSHLVTKVTSFGGAETWGQIDFAARLQTEASPAVLARGMLGMLCYDATSTLSEVSVPALIIPGARDPLCKPEASERMSAALPEAELRPIPRAKHLGFIEYHDLFAREVEEFVRTVSLKQSEELVSH